MGRRRDKSNDAKIVSLYRDYGVPASRIAERFQVNVRTVGVILKKAGVPRTHIMPYDGCGGVVTSQRRIGQRNG